MIGTGVIVKGIAGFYYVDTGDCVVECKARGVFKNEKLKLAVGDEADVELSPDGKSGVIVKIHERKNLFQRPPVANVEQFVVVTALADPRPNLAVVDKFLAAAEMNNVDVVLCFTKKDLVSEEMILTMKEIYSSVYPVVFLDLTDQNGVQDLVPYLYEKKSALAGPSGVGKSTILNALRRDSESPAAQTGSISEKTKRGRHTTRHVELFPMDFGGHVFDTPGFTSFDAPEVSEDELQELFPEIARYMGSCRFNGCRHLNEPDCAVRKAVEEGEIHKKRYESYCAQMEELRERMRKKYQR
ncbi:MAG: ribosome small subunit-dependent GTPase A [Anaerovoracaceae bacterium]